LISIKNSVKTGSSSEKLSKDDIRELLKNRSYMIFILFTILVLGTNNVNNTYFSLYFNKIGGSATLFGIAVFMLTMSEVPFMSWTAKLVTKYGSRNTLLFSGVATVIRWFLYYFFPHPTTVLVSFLLQGASIGVFFVTAAIHIKSIVSEKTISTAITSYMAAGTLGGTIFLVLSGYIIDGFGIRALYLMFLILATVGTAIMVKDKKRISND
jgi:PPP family 3-phenylpropionic acid transporter